MGGKGSGVPGKHSRRQQIDIVLLWLLSNCDDDSTVQATSGQIARDCGLAEPTVRNVIQDLKSCGRIQKIKGSYHHKKEKRIYPTVWKLTI